MVHLVFGKSFSASATKADLADQTISLTRTLIEIGQERRRHKAIRRRRDQRDQHSSIRVDAGGHVDLCLSAFRDWMAHHLGLSPRGSSDRRTRQAGLANARDRVDRCRCSSV